MPRRGLGPSHTNVERRLTRVEQILPTLATKTDLNTAIAPLATRVELEEKLAAAIALLATRAELEEKLAAAVEPLATKAELAAVSNGLRAEIREAAEYTVHRVKLLMDESRAEVRAYADRLAATHERAESAHERIDRLDRQVDARLMRLEASRAKRR